MLLVTVVSGRVTKVRDSLNLDLLSTPEIPVDLTPPVLHVANVDLTAPEFIVDVAIGDAAPPPVAPEASDATLGDVLTCALHRLDDKWTTILTTYNDAQDAQRCRDDEQRRLDREEQHRINAELRMSKKLEFDAFLASSKDAALLETVKSLDKKVTRAHGHITKTALPSLSSRLDILE